MIISLFLALITLFDFQGKDQLLKITASDNDLRLNEPLVVDLEFRPQLEQAIIDQLEQELATERKDGLLQFFLASKEQKPDRITFTLLPQFAGNFTLHFAAIPFDGVQREISPFGYSVEAFPTYEEELTTAPELPLEPQDPLEVDEINKRQLHLLNSRDDASALLKERTISLSNWIALFIGLVLFFLAYLFVSRPQGEFKEKKLSNEEALRRFNWAKSLPKKQGAQEIHSLLMKSDLEENLPLFEKLDQWRFQETQPNDKEWNEMLMAIELGFRQFRSHPEP